MISFKTTRPFRNDLSQIPYDYTVEVRNRFKGLDLIDRGPEELQMEVHDIVQETGIKTIAKKKKCKKAKWLSEEALQIAEKRREAKSKGEKESYTHSNAEFQRIARRDKKAFLSDLCKEIEKNNTMGLQLYLKCELPMFKLVLEKAEEAEIKLPTSIGLSKKQESSKKHVSSLLTMPKPLTVWITTKCGKFLKRSEYQTMV